MPPNQPINDTYDISSSTSSNFYKLENLAPLLQIVIGLSSLFYVTGYLSWAYYATKNDLGILPVIKEKYFMAGIIPVLVTLIIIFIVSIHFNFSAKIYELIKSNVILRKVTTMIIYILYISIIIVVYKKLTHNAIVSWFGLLSCITSIIASYLIILMSFSSISRWTWLSTSLVLWLLLLFMYAELVFPLMPNEFGGPKPYLVELDIKKGELSSATVQELSPPSFVNHFEYSFLLSIDSPRKDHLQEFKKMPLVIFNNEQSQTFRTTPLYLIFEADDFLLLERANDIPISKGNPLFKLKKSVVNNIISIAEDNPFNVYVDSAMANYRRDLDKDNAAQPVPPKDSI